MNNPNNWNQANIAEFRANSGKIGGRFAGRTLLLLHTVGAKSGQERINPVAYVSDGDRLVIIASKGGAPVNPDWYHNILANPLRQMATPMARHLAPSALVILSGLLPPQAKSVIAAYRARGLVLKRHLQIEGWSSLLLQSVG